MTKTHTTVSVDNELIEKARKLRINVSGCLNDYLAIAVARESENVEGINISMEKIKRELRTFLSLEAGLILFSMLLPVIFLKIIPGWQEMGILLHFEPLFYLLSLTGGILVGAEFPLAVKIFLKKSTNFSRSVGLLNALDLTGGWLGGILGGIVLLPILGLGQTCFVLVMLKLTAFILFIFSSKRY